MYTNKLAVYLMTMDNDNHFCTSIVQIKNSRKDLEVKEQLLSSIADLKQDVTATHERTLTSNNLIPIKKRSQNK